ncbi:YozE family protein [Gracilibacillus oryzae]|uniref:YozE family protein n=1 Tax=Gracilibacillus oryzae TaxID=1672701 RepID=A0A7C8KS26_9BACI|nr:YozE family protein [Gracilibacillus oryzae]KAB8138551.1 YozE family protein [Gracilibacillus oryzae]
MKSFYQWMLRYRDDYALDNERKLANWMFSEHDFPIHSKDYNEISQYLEWHIPFADALTTFDQLWEKYREEN